MAYGIGRITLDTPARFQAFVGDLQAAAARGVPIRNSPWVLVLDSWGGNVVGSLQLGRLIRTGGWNTAVGTEYPLPNGVRRRAECYSACVYAFAGGVNRLVLADNVVGVHQFSSGGTMSEGLAQSLAATINLYLDDMGVSRMLQDVAGLTNADGMAVLTVEQAVNLRVAYLTPAMLRQYAPRRGRPKA